MMRELSLFTGGGGGLYGLKLCGARCVCYVEFDPHCQAVIAQRIKDGIFADAPIFSDVRTFDGAVWRGRVDLLSAGFPCTPFSTAGKQLGADDPKNLWPQTARVIREVRPPLVWLENSPALAFRGYLGRVLGDLWALGYDAEWTTLSASACGAPHVRDRIWILAALPDADRETRLTAAVANRDLWFKAIDARAKDREDRLTAAVNRRDLWLRGPRWAELAETINHSLDGHAKVERELLDELGIKVKVPNERAAIAGKGLIWPRDTIRFSAVMPEGVVDWTAGDENTFSVGARLRGPNEETARVSRTEYRFTPDGVEGTVEAVQSSREEAAK